MTVQISLLPDRFDENFYIFASILLKIFCKLNFFIQQVADYIGTEHHEIIFTQQDIIDVLDKVIYSLETFDITTIRA